MKKESLTGGGEIRVSPVKIVSVSPKIAYYIDFDESETKKEEERSRVKDLASAPCFWSYKVRIETITRRRRIKDYLLLINHAF